MPKRYKPSEEIPRPSQINQECVICLAGSKYWTVGLWIDGYDKYSNGGFEVGSYQDDIDYYSLDDIDWWLDPMEVEE